MLTERTRPFTSKVLWAVALFLTAGGSFLNGCDRPTVPEAAPSSSSPTPRVESNTTAATLRADPNPVPAGTPNGKTMITWDAGGVVGEVFVADAGHETLFAAGAKGSQEAPWIPPGATQFRLYSQADHKLLAQLTVTMPLPGSTANKPSATPNPSPAQ